MPAPADPPAELLCRPCKGSGVCPRCDASGLVLALGRPMRCLACRGSTVCPECRGTGWVQRPGGNPLSPDT